ncbi:MAG: subclass B1 metallo-beta-lactamase [Bacteroidia bacterium]|nr:subclass B1 metallo-beta-lactamase [Bacteroidia bacterium]
MEKLLLTILILFPILSLAQNQELIRLSDDLEIQQLTDKVYVHRSYATVEPYGRFYSNGMVYVSEGKAMIFDTPMESEMTEELLDWLKAELKVEIVGIVVNHHHDDCLGGLNHFHDMGVPSWSTSLTRELAIEEKLEAPQNTFKKKKNLSVGNSKVKLFFPGEAHTIDNMVAWLPEEKVLFGGCMVKSLKSGKGNLDDANVEAWPLTIGKVKKKFGDAVWVIPGHGKSGGIDLLDYTIDMFSKK